MTWIFARLLALRTRLRSLLARLQTPSRTRRFGTVMLTSLLLFLVAQPAHASGLSIDDMVRWMADLAFQISAIIVHGVVMIIDMLVPVMTYNDFTTNPVVTAGWAIVRDTVNMFFVIILIIIAVGTIFGHQRFKWQQQVPRLLIWAIVINFSKMLCGIMIDFGQVVMLTFANALREIAAGNFIQLFGLNQLYSASSTADQTLKAFDFLLGGVMSILLTIWVFATMLILAIILIYRIVMLWVLVVIAPLAWFTKGAEGVIKSDAYAEWWNEFKCLVGVGPIIVFFLWLTLSVAGAGNMAALSNFDVSSGSNTTNNPITIFELNNLLSFFIGMAMLYAGFKAAGNFCSGMAGGVVKRATGAVASGQLQKAAIGLTARLGARGAQAGLRGARGSVKLAGRVGANIPGSDRVSRVVAGARTFNQTALGRAAGAVGRVTGSSSLIQAGEKARARGEKARRAGELEVMDRASKKMEGLDTAGKAKVFEALANRDMKDINSRAQLKVLLGDAMNDKDLQKKIDPKLLEKAWQAHGDSYMETHADNKEKMDQVKKFKRQNAFALKRGKDGKVDRKEVEELLQDFDDAKGLSADMLKGPDGDVFRERLKSMNSGFVDNDGKSVNAHDALIQRGEKDVSKALQEELTKAVGPKVDIGTQLADQFERALVHGNEKDQQRLIADFKKRYEGADSQQQQKMERAAARMQASIERRKSAAPGTVNAETEKLMNDFRGDMDKIGYTELPPLEEGMSVDEYVAEDGAKLGGATERRQKTVRDKLNSTANETATEKTKAHEALAKRMDKGGTQNGAIATELNKRRSDYVAKRQKIVDEAYANAYALEREAQDAEKVLNEARVKGDSEEDIKAALELAEDAKKRLKQAQTAAKRKVDNNEELKALNEGMDRLIDTVSGVTDEEKTSMKDANRGVVELEQRQQRLREAHAKLRARVGDSR